VDAVAVDRAGSNYLRIADAIAADVDASRLRVGGRLLGGSAPC